MLVSQDSIQCPLPFLIYTLLIQFHHFKSQMYIFSSGLSLNSESQPACTISTSNLTHPRGTSEFSLYKHVPSTVLPSLKMTILSDSSCSSPKLWHYLPLQTPHLGHLGIERPAAITVTCVSLRKHSPERWGPECLMQLEVQNPPLTGLIGREMMPTEPPFL